IDYATARRLASEKSSSNSTPQDLNKTTRQAHPKRLKVCHMVGTTEGGTWMFEQLSELRDQHGCELHAIVLGYQGRLVDKLRSENIPFHVANFQAGFARLAALVQLPLAILRLAKLLRRGRFVVVQTPILAT